MEQVAGGLTERYCGGLQVLRYALPEPLEGMSLASWRRRVQRHPNLPSTRFGDDVCTARVDQCGGCAQNQDQA